MNSQVDYNHSLYYCYNHMLYYLMAFWTLCIISMLQSLLNGAESITGKIGHVNWNCCRHSWNSQRRLNCLTAWATLSHNSGRLLQAKSSCRCSVVIPAINHPGSFLSAPACLSELHSTKPGWLRILPSQGLNRSGDYRDFCVVVDLIFLNTVLRFDRFSSWKVRTPNHISDESLWFLSLEALYCGAVSSLRVQYQHGCQVPGPDSFLCRYLIKRSENQKKIK